MDVDRPDVVAEVTAAFERYERALVENDVATLNAIFRDDPRTIRYGIAENLYGYDEIKAFRGARAALASEASGQRGKFMVRAPDTRPEPGSSARDPVGLARTRSKTVITAYGRDFAVASTLFQRSSSAGKVGRQMQTWVRFADGWQVVAAHVSLIDASLVAASLIDEPPGRRS